MFDLIAIDGPSASGKSSMAKKLSVKLNCFVVHMDDFYLPKDKRDLNKIAGNIDFERLLNEVIRPYKEAHHFFYRTFDCQSQKLSKAKEVEDSPYLIVEGSFSLHELLRDHYEYKIFLRVDPKLQKERLIKREGAHYAAFEAIWLPNEERYFKSFDPFDVADEII